MAMCTECHKQYDNRGQSLSASVCPRCYKKANPTKPKSKPEPPRSRFDREDPI